MFFKKTITVIFSIFAFTGKQRFLQAAQNVITQVRAVLVFRHLGDSVGRWNCKAFANVQKRTHKHCEFQHLYVGNNSAGVTFMQSHG